MAKSCQIKYSAGRDIVHEDLVHDGYTGYERDLISAIADTLHVDADMLIDLMISSKPISIDDINGLRAKAKNRCLDVVHTSEPAQGHAYSNGRSIKKDKSYQINPVLTL